MAAKGGKVRDITVGDCLELADHLLGLGSLSIDTSVYFYQLLHATEVFPKEAPATVRLLDPKNQGQISVEQMIDRYGIACRPVRDLLVDYLHERELSSTTSRCGPWPSAWASSSGRTWRITTRASTPYAWPWCHGRMEAADRPEDGP